MNGEELNPQDSSQAAPSVSAGEAPNAAGKPSEPVVSSMTPSQSADYYNKTQQLAQERRALEEERRTWEQQKSQNAPQNYGQNQGYGGQYPAANSQQFIPQIDPQTYAALVEQFGVEGANVQARAIQQTMLPVQEALEDARQAKIISITQSLNLKGQSLYGEEWKSKGDDAMKLVVKHGMPLEQAWYAANGAAIEQAAIDRAYQGQQTKQDANVQQGRVQPAATQSGDVSSIGDAFNAAWNQYNG